MTTTPAIDTIPPIHHREAMELAETAYRRFADVVGGMGDADWERPTDCEGWTVRHLVGHVVGEMRMVATVREMASQQQEIRRRRRRDGGNETDIMTALHIELTAALTVTELAAESRALVSKATAGRRRIPAPARRLVRIPATVGTKVERWSLGHLTDIILTRDTWLHRIDLCRAIGAEPLLTPDHDGRIVADVVADWARRHGRPYHLRLSGPAGGEFAAGPATAAMEIDAVEFCRILSGRGTGDGLLATPVPF